MNKWIVSYFYNDVVHISSHVTLAEAITHYNMLVNNGMKPAITQR